MTHNTNTTSNINVNEIQKVFRKYNLYSEKPIDYTAFVQDILATSGLVPAFNTNWVYVAPNT